MEQRYLGRSGLRVPALGFGAGTFGGHGPLFSAWGNTDVAGARRIVDICLDAGITLFDTADVYSNGASEEILGAALRGRRSRAIVSTKLALRSGDGPNDVGASRTHLVDATHAALRRLRTDHIDILQLHAYDAMTPVEQVLRTLDDLVRAGKVRYLGVSNFAGWQLMKAQATSERRNISTFVSQQIQYSLVVRDAEDELLPCGVDQGVGALIWSPLAQGFLSGKFRNVRSGTTRLELSNRLKAYETPQGEAVLAALDRIAAAHSATPSQVALNWLLKRPGVSSVLVGARTDEQLIDNLAAANWSLSTAEVEELDRASQVPMRYPNSHHRIFTSERNPQLFPRYKLD